MKYVIKGPNTASGEVVISGAKNFSIKALALSLLQDGVMEYHNVPNNIDVFKTNEMLRALGAKVEFDAQKKYARVEASSIVNVLEDDTHANMMVFLIGASLIHKYDYVRFPKMNKGCPLGKRADDFHIMAFENFGVSSLESENEYVFKKEFPLVGCDIVLPYPSVGATETAIFLAAKANGMTRIFNAAIEPEVQALVTALITMGANIFFVGDREIVVHGVEKLHSVRVDIHGDYLEAASWAIMAAATDGEIVVRGVVPELIGAFLGIFNMMGGSVKRLGDDVLKFSRARNFIRPERTMVLETGVFPKLRTDLQPLLAVLAGVHNIKTIVHDTVYNDRVRYVETFRQFGLRADGSHDCFDNKCRFHESSGTKSMHSALIDGLDGELVAPSNVLVPTTIRSGMAEIILAAAACGITVIDKVEVIERGYCDLFNKLVQIGINITTLE